MPSIIRADDDAPLAKRPRLNGDATSRTTPRESKIFTPFRVRIRVSILFMVVLTSVFLDHWLSILHLCALHIHPAGQDDLSDHDIGWKMPTDIRS